jgi:hypothetical protein
MKKLLLLLLGLILLPNIAWGSGLRLNQGGTGYTTSTAGDLLVGTTSPLRYTRLPIGSEGTCLGVVGGTLSYTTCGTGSGGNPFNQWLDTTSSVQFASVTSTGNINALGILGTISGTILNAVSGSAEGFLNAASIFFQNTDEPEKTGLLSFSPTNNSFALGSVNSNGDLRSDMKFSIYGETDFSPQATTTNDITWIDSNYTSNATTSNSGTLGMSHNSLVVNGDYDGTAGLDHWFKVFGNQITRQGTVDNYGASNIERNASQRNWTANNATYSGTENLRVDNISQASVLRDALTFDSTGKVLTLTDTNFHIDSVITATETNGTINGNHSGLWIENVDSDGTTITNGKIDTYGIEIGTVSGNPINGGETYGIKDNSAAGWYNTGALNVLGTTTLGTSGLYTMFSNNGAIPFIASYYTNEDPAVVPFFTTINDGIIIASDVLNPSGNIASTSVTAIYGDYDEGAEKETLTIASILGRDLLVDVFGDLNILTGKGITLGGEYRTTWPTGSGGGDSSFWATSSNSLIGYPNLSGDFNIVIGASVTTTNDILQVIGSAYVSENLTVAGDGTFDNLTVSNIATTTELCFAAGGCMTSPSTAGSNVIMYHWNGSADIAGYEMFRTYPDSGGTNNDETCSADADIAGGYCNIDPYISTTTDLSISSIPAGVWNFHYYTYVNSATGISNILADVYKRTSGGVETLLFTATSTELNNLTVAEVEFTSVQPAFTFSNTDRFVVKVRGYTNSGTAKIIHFLYGGVNANYSHIETPINVGNFNYARKDLNETITGAWTFSNILNLATTSASTLSIDNLGRLNFEGFSPTGVPAIYADNDGDSGIHFDGPDIVSIHTGGSDRIMVNSSGYIGINTSTPAFTLDVFGTTRVTGTSTLSTLILNGITNSVLAVDGSGKVIATSTASAPIETDPVWTATSSNYATLAGNNSFTGNVGFTYPQTVFLNNTFELSSEEITTSKLATTDVPFLKATTIGVSGDLAIYGLGATPSLFIGSNADENLLSISKTDSTEGDFRFVDASDNILDALFVFNGKLEVTGTSTLPNLILTGLSNSYLAVDSTGKVIATSSPSAIADGSITLAKMANLAYGNIIGRSTNSTGVPQALSTSTYKGMLALTKTDVGLSNVTNNAQYYPGGTDVAVADGGTGTSTYATGDILYADSANTLAKLAMGSTGRYLRSVTGAAPVWSTLILPNTGTSGRLAAYTSGNTLGELAAGTTGQYLSGATGLVPAWATLNQAAVAGLTTTSVPLFAGIKIGTTTAEAKIDVWGTSGGKILTLFSNTGTKFLQMLNTGVTTLLGTWDFSGATVKQHTYGSFTYSTSTAWAGTSTIPLGPAYTAESWSGVRCFTDAGTLNVSFYDGTNRMNAFTASTTAGQVNFTTNNTFTAGEKRYVDVGTPASSPTKISCTVDKTVNN